MKGKYNCQSHQEQFIITYQRDTSAVNNNVTDTSIVGVIYYL